MLHWRVLEYKITPSTVDRIRLATAGNCVAIGEKSIAFNERISTITCVDTISSILHLVMMDEIACDANVFRARSGVPMVMTDF